MKEIKKAVIAAAGLATRFFPITKTIPKQLLPLLNKPIIQYVVEEIALAGIEDILIVTGPNGKLFSDYFGENRALEVSLVERKKSELIPEIKKLHQLANILVIEQEPAGNGAPILAAEKFVDGDPFVFAFGDDIVISKESFTGKLLDEYYAHACPIIGAQRIPESDVSKFGIIKLKDGTREVSGIVEKPEATTHQSELAEFGRMILDSKVIEILKTISTGRGGELWLVDALEKYIEDGGVLRALEVENGRWYTTGDPASHLEATIVLAMKDPILKKLIKNTLEGLSLQ